MIDFLRRCLLVVIFVLTIGLLFVGGNKEKLEDVLADKNVKEIKLISNMNNN
ncbi:hypothetical protein [Bacillus sp. EAC]|uniref:hypothetical protein n=1 Tax=Bacillus sp. EAC TaxID=1978338 RepID=UPI0015C51611|nr:hypothetical protein [Bacillus sp. EAC]